MDNNIVFNFFSDSKATAISKLSNYLQRPEDAIQGALEYGCSLASFINELRVDLSACDSSDVYIVGRHVTTSSEEEIVSFHKSGLLNLRSSLQEETPLSVFLKRHKIQIDVDRKLFSYNRRTIPIEGKKNSDHKCFMGRETACTWSLGCEALEKLGILHTKLYELGATLEFFVAGTLEEMLEYSTVSRCPEILDTIDQLIEKLNKSYGSCTYPLSFDWISQHPNCYVIEFKCMLSDMETFDPINYLDAYDDLKDCFVWSNISYNDYYNCRVPQRVFDNRYLISRIIDVYVYGGREQYGSLQPGLSISSDALKMYLVDEDELISL